MNETLTLRVTAMTGLALAAAVAVWWLGSARLAIDRGADASRSAADALQALWLARGVLLAVLGVSVGAVLGWRSGAVIALALVAPSWPLVVLAWSASTTPLVHAALAETLLLTAGFALPLIGLGLRRVLRRAELADIVGAGVGIALAACVWVTRGFWTPPPS